MGGDIAVCLVHAGCDVVLQSRRAEARDRFLGTVAEHCARQVRHGRMSAEEAAASRARARATGAYEGFQDREFVLEAVSEDTGAKAEVLRHLEQICSPEAVIATTTSSLTIGELAATLSRPERLVGTHFFNPVRFIRVVEVVHTPRTAPAYLARATRFVEVAGKTPLHVPDGVGFLVNRVLLPGLLEGVRVYIEHAATLQEIDQAWIGAGALVGPCAMLDIVGLDVALDICRNFARCIGPAYQPPLLLERLVVLGRLGRKSGRGIYFYPRGRPETDPAVDAIREEIERVSGAPHPTRFSVQRLLAVMINEAIACVADGVATAGEIDFALTETIGMPRGGLLAHCAGRGWHAYLAELEALAAEFGERFLLRPHLAAFLARDRVLVDSQQPPQ